MAQVEINQMSAEELISLGKKRQAEERLAELRTKGLADFKQAVAKESNFDNVVRLAKNFTTKREGLKRILEPSEHTGRGRKPKNQTK